MFLLNNITLELTIIDIKIDVNSLKKLILIYKYFCSKRERSVFLLKIKII